MNITYLNKNNATEITDVYCESFYNYPVMKYVLGDKGNYDTRFHKLVTFFVSARAFRNEPMFGIYNSENKITSLQ